MSRWIGLALVALIACSQTPPLSACGDKFLLLGRSVGYDQILKASRPGTVLLYSSPNLPTVLSDGRFSALLELAGHRQRAITDRQTLEQALRSGKVDLVLADPAASHDIADVVRTSSTALIVPVLSKGAAASRSDLQRTYAVVLELADGTKLNPRQIVNILDQAMKVKAKRGAVRPA
jgi:hypothetical protein